MEGKIVAATFTTLALVFAGMSGTSVNTDVDEVLPSESPVNGLTPSFDIVDSLMENPEAENPAKIEIQLKDRPQLNIETEKLEVEGLKTVESSVGIQSEEDLIFEPFTGNIKMDENTTSITGSAEGFSNSRINVTSKIGIDQEVETELLEASGLERNSFTLQTERVQLEAKNGSSNIDQKDKEVEITSFTGDLDFEPPNSLKFDGEVATVNAGQTSFGN
ncbi:MAG: hypothetical protein ACLFRK_00895 [Candidatus Nanohaloarchaea archaeon]